MDFRAKLAALVRGEEGFSEAGLTGSTAAQHDALKRYIRSTPHLRPLHTMSALQSGLEVMQRAEKTAATSAVLTLAAKNMLLMLFSLEAFCAAAVSNRELPATKLLLTPICLTGEAAPRTTLGSLRASHT